MIRQLLLDAELSLLIYDPVSVVSNLWCSIYGILTFIVHLFDGLIGVHNDTNMTLFVHKTLSPLKSLFEIRIERFFSDDVGDSIVLIFLSFLVAV